MATREWEITATLIASSHTGGWAFIVMPDAVEFASLRGAVSVSGTVDGRPFRTVLMDSADGTHRLLLRAALCAKIGKRPGDTVEIRIRRTGQGHGPPERPTRRLLSPDTTQGNQHGNG